MGNAWRRVLLPAIIVFVLIIYEEWASTPSCKLTNPDGFGGNEYDSEDDLKVMMVSNLLLLGSESGFFNLYFRDYYMSKFFRKSFTSLKPDMLLVMGDVSAKGSELTKTKWLSVVHQFNQMVGSFMLPFHVVVGDRDVGECNELDSKSVYWIARSFPGLDSSGCGAFEISNISFVSLNAVALLCGNNRLRFSVEKVIERESDDLQMEIEGSVEADKVSEMSHKFGWRENSLASGSGPVLLLHFPLHRPGYGKCREGNVFKNPSQQSLSRLESRGFAGTGPYDLLHTVPPNATEYIFQALKPRIIFSAHTHEFCDYTHSDGTREVTVPAMTWKARDDPGFVMATFRRNRAVSVSYCSLPRESHVLIAYTSGLVLLLLIMLLTNTPQLTCLRR